MSARADDLLVASGAEAAEPPPSAPSHSHITPTTTSRPPPLLSHQSQLGLPEDALMQALARPLTCVCPPSGGFLFGNTVPDDLSSILQVPSPQTSDAFRGEREVKEGAPSSTAAIDDAVSPDVGQIGSNVGGCGHSATSSPSDVQPDVMDTADSSAGYEIPSVLEQCNLALEVLATAPIPDDEFVPKQAPLPIEQMLMPADPDPEPESPLSPGALPPLNVVDTNNCNQAPMVTSPLSPRRGSASRGTDANDKSVFIANTVEVGAVDASIDVPSRDPVLDSRCADPSVPLSSDDGDVGMRLQEGSGNVSGAPNTSVLPLESVEQRKPSLQLSCIDSDLSPAGHVPDASEELPPNMVAASSTTQSSPEVSFGTPSSQQQQQNTQQQQQQQQQHHVHGSIIAAKPSPSRNSNPSASKHSSSTTSKTSAASRQLSPPYIHPGHQQQHQKRNNSHLQQHHHPESAAASSAAAVEMTLSYRSRAQVSSNQSSSRLLPNQSSSSRLLPDQSGSSRLLPNKSSSSRLLPNQNSSSRLLPQKDSSRLLTKQSSSTLLPKRSPPKVLPKRAKKLAHKKAFVPYTAEELHRLVCPEIGEVDFISPSSITTDKLLFRISPFFANANTRKVEWALRAGLSATVAGTMVLYGPLANTRAEPIYTLLLLQASLIDMTLGRTLKNSFAVVVGALLGVVFPYLLLPTGLLDTSFASRNAVGTFFVFALTTAVTYFLSNTQSKKFFMAINALLLLLTVTGDDGAQDDPYVYPLRYILGTCIGALISVAANLLPFPRLATSELKFRIRLGYQQALNTFNILIYTFVSTDELQRYVLATRARLRLGRFQANISALTSSLGDAWWEGYTGSRLGLATAEVEQLQQLLEALRGIEEVACKGSSHIVGPAQARFLEFMRAPLTVLTTRCEQLVRFEVSGDQSAEQATTLGGGENADAQWDGGPMSAHPLVTWNELIQKPMEALWTAYRNARYEILYSERYANMPPEHQWSVEDHLAADFFVFSLSEFATALRASPRRVLAEVPAVAEDVAGEDRINIPNWPSRIRAALFAIRHRTHFLRRLKPSAVASPARRWRRPKFLPKVKLDRHRLWLSLRHSIALTVSTVLNFTTDFASPLLIFAVSFLISDRTGSAFSTALQRFVGVAIGGLFGFLAVYGVEGAGPFLLVLTFVWIAVCTFPRLKGKWNLALLLAASTSMLVMFPDVGSTQDVDNVESNAQARTSMTFLASAIYLVASLLIAPKKSSTSVTERFQDFLLQTRQQLDTCFSLYANQLDADASKRQQEQQQTTGAASGLTKSHAPRQSLSSVTGPRCSREPSRNSTHMTVSVTEAAPAVPAIDRRAKQVARTLLRTQSSRLNALIPGEEPDPEPGSRYLVSDELLDFTQELVKSLRRSEQKQQEYMAEARDEPQFGAPAFPTRCYERIAHSQRVVVRFMGLLVAALRNVDVELLPVQMRYMRISFERIKDNMTAALDTLAHVVAHTSPDHETASDLEEVLESDSVKLHQSLETLDDEFNDYARYISSAIREHVSQSRFDADVTYAQYRMLWGVNAFVFCTRTILRHIIKIEHSVVAMLHFRLDDVHTS